MQETQETLQIRPAQPEDAEVASLLLYSAYIHTQITYPLPEDQERGFAEHLQRFFQQEGNRFSYQYIQVAQQNTEVVGLLLSFGGRDEPRLNAAAGPWLEREAENDEWYIDAVAVLRDWGRQGIATRLLHNAEEQARAHHYAKIALNVAQDNTPALNLYTHLGYGITRHTTLYSRPYVRMVKMLA